MKSVTIYTDGACSHNPGPGGWACILIYKNIERELSGGEPATTNNRMELTAAVKGLEALTESCEVMLYSDSSYLINGLEKGWARAWKRKGWIKSNGEPALNPDLWDLLLSQCDKHKISFQWVRGHNGNEYNERCDRLAVSRRDEMQTEN